MSESNQRERAFELLVFDWDGTISDSLGFIVRSVQYAIARSNLPVRSVDVIKAIIGLGLEQAMSTLYPDIELPERDAMVAHYRQHYLSIATGQVELFPNIESTLQALLDSGYTIAVATGKSRRGLEHALTDSGLRDFFHFSRCADETFSKPHPQMLEEILDLAMVDADKALMIGDTEHDLQMARNAGVRSAAVTYGAQESDFLLKFDPLHCFDDLGELPEWLSTVELATA